MAFHGLTENQYYGGLNNRFDRRVRMLLRAGYTYSESGWNRGGFRPGYRILSSHVMHADKRAFIQTLAQRR